MAEQQGDQQLGRTFLKLNSCDNHGDAIAETQVVSASDLLNGETMVEDYEARAIQRSSISHQLFLQKPMAFYSYGS